MQPLYGHVSPETAYTVADYPYGYRLRCTIRYWLESDPKRGFRLVSQTSNPKKPGNPWNKPKASTYSTISACMFLDDQEHVQWVSFSDYKADEALKYVESFCQAAGIGFARYFTRLKIQHLSDLISGKRYFTVNGVRQPYSDADRERHQAELEAWQRVLAAFNRLGIEEVRT